MKSIWILLLALAACGPAMRDPGEGDDDGSGSGSGSGSGTGEERQCNQMDIIFVVDDSGSMSEEQSNLGANFPMFASLLQSYTNADGDHIDFRVAVTTTGRDMDYSIDIGDRKSTRLNSSHLVISYAVFCLKKKNRHTIRQQN